VSERSPLLPWKEDGLQGIRDAQGRAVAWLGFAKGHGSSMRLAADEPLANALFICRAVNLHAELVEALILALPFVEAEEANPAYDKGVVRRMVRMMRAAIAKAEEGK